MSSVFWFDDDDNSSHRENATQVSQLESVLSERASTINMLQERLTATDKTLKQQENLLIDKDKIYQKLVEKDKKQREEWEKVMWFAILLMVSNRKLNCGIILRS